MFTCVNWKLGGISRGRKAGLEKGWALFLNLMLF
uniref:Uncharacterized protein n=1 Tax=Arundo donax TaxID=35708 RepID=A0A0A8ZKS8_ARUDO